MGETLGPDPRGWVTLITAYKELDEEEKQASMWRSPSDGKQEHILVVNDFFSHSALIITVSLVACINACRKDMHECTCLKDLSAAFCRVHVVLTARTYLNSGSLATLRDRDLLRLSGLCCTDVWF